MNTTRGRPTRGSHGGRAFPPRPHDRRGTIALIRRQLGTQRQSESAKTIDKGPNSQYFWSRDDHTWGHRAMSEQHSPIGIRRVETTTFDRASTDARSPEAHSGQAGASASPASRALGRRRSDRIVAASASTQAVVDQASAIARSETPVLVIGPSGSGRKHLARAIHQWSARAGGPLVEVQLAGTPEAVQQREIFGDGGAQAGALARAEGGSLLLESVDQLAPALLQRLADGLRGGTIRARLIGTAARAAATSPLGAHAIELGSLAERREDILPLAAHFLAEFAAEESIEAIGFNGEARRLLLEESWPGNVRELRERIRQAIRLAGQGAISAEALMLATDLDDVPSFKDAKRAFETRYVEVLLRRCGGNISRAARMAKKDRKDFYDVIRRTGIDPGQFRG
ncbi:MAG: sigma 54-interacting transcriptional regulator [Myxococcota bacterium]